MNTISVSCFSIILCLAIQIMIVPVGADSTQVTKQGDLLSNDVNFLSKYQKNFTEIDPHPIVAYSKSKGSNVFLAYDQAQIALNYLELAAQAQDSKLTSLRSSYIQNALAIVKFMNTYLINSIISEKLGIIEYWDNILQGVSYVRASKLARDQALTLLTIDKLLTFFDLGYVIDSTSELLLKQEFSNLWDFLSTLYDNTNGGWYTKSTVINQTASSIDTTKHTADNMIIISSLAELTHITLLAPGFTKSNLMNILTKSMNFFINKFLVNGKGIVSFGSLDGSFISDNTFFAHDNALFGLTLLNLYNLTSNSTYLTDSKYIWSYLKQSFWDVGPGGLFIGVNAAGVTTIAGKSIEDQIFFSLLSLKLASLQPSNATYVAYFLQLSILISYNFVQGDNVASSTDLRFNPSSEYYARSASYYVDFMSRIPHISSIEYFNDVIIGSNLPLTIYISNSNLLPLNITITADKYLNPITILSSSDIIQKELEFTSDIQSGTQIVYLNLYIYSSLMQTLPLIINFSPNVRIPNGLIYLIGAGILAGIILIVRRPPEALKKYIQELKNIQPEISTTETQEEK